MAQTSRLSNRRIVGRHQPVMFGKPRQRDLQHDLASPCRLAVCLLDFLQTFQLAANIDQDS